MATQMQLQYGLSSSLPPPSEYLPAKKKVLDFYNISTFKLLLKKNREPLSVAGKMLTVTESVEPHIITWENLGRPKLIKVLRYIFSILAILGFFVVSFIIMRLLYLSDNDILNSIWTKSVFASLSNYILLLALNKSG